MPKPCEAGIGISRAKTHATIYTDDRLALVDAIEGRDGAKVGPIDEALLRGKVAAIAIPAPVRAAGIAINGYVPLSSDARSRRSKPQ